ncbi:MAG TPA: NAD(P)H-binding protein [Solirubrobacteraceae bacterium]|nr:NAD(P)H-binding protein [Solirubrobacteraceae bacterium]
MTGAILVIGVTGTVGGATLRALSAAGQEPAAFVRDPERAASEVGEAVPLVTGDLADEASVRAALDGIDGVLLCSAHGPAMREQQLTAVRAIAASDARRIVKISGSPVSIAPDSPAASGRDHLAIEEALQATGRETVALRPNTFMQNFLEQSLAVGHGALPGPEGDPRVSFVDARDVGAVAAAALLAEDPPEPVLEVTGPEALTWFEVAETMSSVLGRPVTHYPTPPEVIRQGLLGMGRPEWLVEHLLELAPLMREPKAAEVTDTVERMAGRPATSLLTFLHEHAAMFQAAA